MSNDLRWYGYRHKNGTLHVKRFVGSYGTADMREHAASPYVSDVWGPFDAQNQHSAKIRLRKLAERDNP